MTADAATDALVRHIAPDRLTALAVGDREKIAAGLSGLGLGDPLVLAPETFW